MDKKQALEEVARIELEAPHLADPRDGIKALAALVGRLIAEGVAPEAAE